MGIVGCCRIQDSEEEKKLEKQNLYGSNKEKAKKTDNLDLLSSEQPTTIKFNNSDNLNKTNVDNQKMKINEKTLIDDKIKKIQQKYRSYYLKKKFDNEIKPIIKKKADNYIDQFYQQCKKGGEITTDDDFDPEKWKEFYPSNERFFLYKKGEVFENQIRIKNQDDPDNLEVYEGETNIENLKHGFGTLTTPHYILKGTWRKDEFTGWGRKSWRNGDILEGKFINGELNGKGIFKSKDGNIYVGDFENSMRNGKGELKTNKFHYIGEFKNGELNGKGSISFIEEGHKYEGDFENNVINGKGIYKWKNGDIYEGQMENGKMNGYGKYIYSNGKIYEGEYVNGIKQGRGKLIYPNNKMYEGYFDNGKPNGEGFYTEDGHVSKVLFSNGKFAKLIA